MAAKRKPKRKPSKNKKKDSALDRAAEALVPLFPVVVKDKSGAIWVGTDALLFQSNNGGGRIDVRFSIMATKPFKEALSKALADAKVAWETGDQYDFDAKTGTATDIVDEEPGHRWIARMTGHAHVLRCLLCREMMVHAAGAKDDAYFEEVKVLVSKHMLENPIPSNHACHYPGCVHHEKLPRALAESVVRVGHGDLDVDACGVKYGTVSLVATEKDAPAGFDLKRQDAAQRTKDGCAAGDVYVRLGPKVCMAHVWVSPAYASRRASTEDPAAIWEIIETFQKRLPALKEWCMRKYLALKELAEMDAQFPKEEKQEDRGSDREKEEE